MAEVGRYIDPSDLPIAGRDDFDREEKVAVIPDAESQVVWRVNGGEQFGDEFNDQHKKAMKAYASYMLMSGAGSYDDARYGDVVNNDEDRNPIDRFYQMYLDAVEAVLGQPEGSDGDGGGGSGGNNVDTITEFQFNSYG